jgi:hypothetical protein
MKTITIVTSLLFILPTLLFGAGPGGISGAVAYTDIIRFDYTKDGVRNRVQFWVEFKGKTAVGTKEKPGYVPEEGSIFYYLLDVDNIRKVTNWLMGFSMVSEPAPSGPYPITNLVIEGKTARFEAFNRKWTVVDGGKGFENDTVLVDDGFKPKPLKMYSGDLTVGGEK